jgi:putative endonuclease
VTSARRPERRPGWRVYLLRCRDGSLYAGVTNDLARRLERHAEGKGARYTRSRLPVALVYEERASGRGAALRREAELKRLDRAGKLALVAARGAGRGRRDAVTTSTSSHERPAGPRRAGRCTPCAR